MQHPLLSSDDILARQLAVLNLDSKGSQQTVLRSFHRSDSDEEPGQSQHGGSSQTHPPRSPSHRQDDENEGGRRRRSLGGIAEVAPSQQQEPLTAAPVIRPPPEPSYHPPAHLPPHAFLPPATVDPRQLSDRDRLRPPNIQALLSSPSPSLIPENSQALSSSESGDSHDLTEGEALREHYNLGPGPLSLSMLPDPAPGERPLPPLHLLAALAIYTSPNKRLTLTEIKTAIQERYEFFRRDNRWEGSLRHALSLQGVFRRVEKPMSVPGRGDYWMLAIERLGERKRERKRGRNPLAAAANTQREDSSSTEIPPQSDSEDDSAGASASSSSSSSGSSRSSSTSRASSRTHRPPQRRNLRSYPFSNVIGSSRVPNPSMQTHSEPYLPGPGMSPPPAAGDSYYHHTNPQPPPGLTRDYTNPRIAPLRPPYPGYGQPRMSDPSPGLDASLYHFPGDSNLRTDQFTGDLISPAPSTHLGAMHTYAQTQNIPTRSSHTESASSRVRTSTGNPYPQVLPGLPGVPRPSSHASRPFGVPETSATTHIHRHEIVYPHDTTEDSGDSHSGQGRGHPHRTGDRKGKGREY